MSGGVSAAFSELWVCFEPPAGDPPPQTIVLSFLAPGADAAMEELWGPQFVSGRAVVQEVRSRARAEYLRLIARIGATPCVDGRTLRQALQDQGNYSRWWFLDITEKDCLWDEDTIYLTVLQVMAVREMRERYHLERVTLHGAGRAFAAALDQRAPGQGAIADLARALAFGLLGRLMLLAEYVDTWWMLRGLPSPAGEHRDVLLQGYWDRTMRPAPQGGLRDAYFTDLPAKLADRGLSAGWLASCEPASEPWQRGRRKREVLAASCAHPEVTILERYVTPGDVVRTVSYLRDPVLVTRGVSGRAFRTLCSVGGFNLYPLVRQQLLRAAWGATFCRLQLVATATARACRRLRPEVVLTAFELLLRSRALYAGVRAYSSGARVWAAQHAGYSSDKTLGVFDPDIEVRGTPDGCAVPAPDGIFSMGDLSRRMWEGDGFAAENVLLTGGLRYQGVRIESRGPRAEGGQITLLLAGGMCEAAHVDLCDAVVSATSGLEAVRLHWRDHPLYLFSQRHSFRRFRESITVTSCTLDEDFQAADLVLFSQTGLAEEALLRGIPTWQWLWPGFNTSPFLDVPVIPSFTSVTALRRELQAFVREPARYQPTAETQRRVLHECFGPDPAAASARIADAIQHMTAADARAHV